MTTHGFLEQVDEQGLANLLKENDRRYATVLLIRPRSPSLATSGSSLEDMLAYWKIETIPRDSLTELADHFRKSLETRAADFSDTPGRRALDAILAAMPAEQSQTGQRVLRRWDGLLYEQVRHHPGG